MKGMPGMEGIKMFSGDDFKNMNCAPATPCTHSPCVSHLQHPATADEQMGSMFGGGGGGGGRPKPRKTRSQYKRELVEWYKRYGMEEKLEGVDAALDKWKGKEDRSPLTRTLTLTLPPTL